LALSGSAPWIEKAWQVGQVTDPYSISLIGALGLPIKNPPSGVAETVVAHSVPAGGATAATGPDAATVELPAPELQAASARIATPAIIIFFIIIVTPSPSG